MKKVLALLLMVSIAPLIGSESKNGIMTEIAKWWQNEHEFLNQFEDSKTRQECINDSERVLRRWGVQNECDFVNSFLEARTQDYNYHPLSNDFVNMYCKYFPAASPAQEERFRINEALLIILAKESDDVQLEERDKLYELAKVIENKHKAKIIAAQQRADL